MTPSHTTNPVNRNTITQEICRWKFTMADELPGPSVGDAAEIIEHLGCDPWSFDSLRLVAESCHGEMAFSRFEITGSPAQIRGLREAFGQVTDPADALVIRRPH